MLSFIAAHTHYTQRWVSERRFQTSTTRALIMFALSSSSSAILSDTPSLPSASMSYTQA